MYLHLISGVSSREALGAYAPNELNKGMQGRGIFPYNYVPY